jgi:hypothetical protein
VTETAGDVYQLRVRLGRRLPTALVISLAFIRNLALALVPPWVGATQVAPQYVQVVRRGDQGVVALVFAGRDFGDGDAVLAAMGRTLHQLTPEEFLDTWHARRV